MEFRFYRTGAERKALVMAISEIMEVKAQYLGAPGFGYKVGDIIISKDGVVETDTMDTEALSTLLDALAARGFVPEIMCEPAAAAPAEQSAAIVKTEAIIETTEEFPAALCIELPGEGLSGAALDNLRKLVARKADLIRRALGHDLVEDAEALPIITDGEKVQFPWFRFGMDAQNIAAWSAFASALLETAKKQKRVIMKEKPLAKDDSEKYAMRCLLLKLGFIGEVYKDTRRIILAGLSGDGAHKSGKQGALVSCCLATGDYNTYMEP